MREAGLFTWKNKKAIRNQKQTNTSTSTSHSTQSLTSTTETTTSSTEQTSETPFIPEKAVGIHLQAAEVSVTLTADSQIKTTTHFVYSGSDYTREFNAVISGVETMAPNA